jgi:hypothetical protein
MCDGCLVLHRDGMVAFCTEELDGRHCEGYDAPHLAGVMSCRVSPRKVNCRRCQQAMQYRLMVAPEFVPEIAPAGIN